MPVFASSWRAAESKASPVMNNDTVKPMPATRAHTDDVTPAHIRREAGQAEPRPRAN